MYGSFIILSFSLHNIEATSAAANYAENREV